MHSAPSVSFPVARSRLAARMLAACWLAGAVATGLYLTQSPASLSRALALAGWLAAGGLVAARGWLASPRGTLAWDGEAWTWSDGAPPRTGSIDVALDLQTLLLLRWSGGGTAPRWLWAERAHDAGRWDALRRAVYSRARPNAPRPPQQPAAKP
jgi:toxin CptA